MSNMNFLTADVIQFVSGTIITFSQGDATKTKSKKFSEFGSWTIVVSQVYPNGVLRHFIICHVSSVIDSPVALLVTSKSPLSTGREAFEKDFQTLSRLMLHEVLHMIILSIKHLKKCNHL